MNPQFDQELDPENSLPEPERAILDARFAGVGELKLEPFAAMRSLIAQTMGFRFPYIGREAVEQYRDTGIYPGAMRDVAIYFWVRTVSRDKLGWAYWHAAAALNEAVEWAASQRLCEITGVEFAEAFSLMQKLQNAQADARPVPQAGGEETRPQKKNPLPG